MASLDAIPLAGNSIANQSDSDGVTSHVLQAIKNAAARTGVDFSYLVQKAAQESGFDITAKAATSSATGLYQFTGQTWLHMIKNFGEKYGLKDEAAKITSVHGHLTVADHASKKEILALRNDPTISAEMAGELDKQNAATLKATVGGKIGSVELYLAHFLGAGGASDFISEMRANPKATGESVVPAAAAANESVFYNKAGQPRTLAEIYHNFAHKFEAGATQVAQLIAKHMAPLAASYAVADSATAVTTVPAATSMARLYSSMPVANAATSVATYTSSDVGATATVHVNKSAIKPSSATTYFSAMLLGQINSNNAVDPTGAYTFLNHADKKHDGVTDSGSVG